MSMFDDEGILSLPHGDVDSHDFETIDQFS